MLKKYSKKSVLLLGAVLALSAFTMPSMASAVSWVGSGDIHSNNLGFQSFAGAASTTSACNAVTFQTARHSGTILTITTATFDRCHGSGGVATGCTVTPTGTRYPWRVTAESTTDIRIDGVHLDVRFETTPGINPPVCAANGAVTTLTGTLGLGIGTQTVYDPIGKRVTFNSTTGLAAHTAITGANGVPTTVFGNAVATGTLNLVD